MGYFYCQWLAVIMKAHSFSCSENFSCMPASMRGIFFAYALSVSAGSGAFCWRISLWKVRRQGMASQSSASIVSR